MKKIPKALTDRLDFAGLTDEEKAEIKERAIAQVQKERKAREEESYMVVALDEARRSLIPEEALVDVFVDLPGHAVRILIDGVEYIHGYTYEVGIQKAATMVDIMQRAWDHEDEVGGANRNFYRRPMNQRLDRRHSNITTRQLHAV